MNNDGLLVCDFKQNYSSTSRIVITHVTGDMAFQAIALGKESMATWWCMLCKASRHKFMDENSKMRAMDDLARCGIIAENTNNEPQLGVKQLSW